MTIIDRFHYTKSKSSSQSNHTLFGSALYVSSYFESQSYFECMQLCIIRKCFIRMRCTDHTQYLTWISHMLCLSTTAVCSTHTGAVHTYVYASAYSNTWRLFDHTSELTSECTTTVSLTDTAMHVTDMNVRSSTYGLLCWGDEHCAHIAGRLLAHDNCGCCFSRLCLLALLDGIPHCMRLWLIILGPAIDVNQSEVVLLCTKLRRVRKHMYSNT